MNTTAQIKQNAKKIAQQIANEPLELLKRAQTQIAPEQNTNVGQNPRQETDNQGASKEEQEYKKNLAERDGQKLLALENELLDIRRKRIFDELTRRIQSGEDVSIEEFSELSFEQREVLKAQLEAMQKQKTNSQNQNSGGLVEPAAKKGRRMTGFGQKQAAQKQTTRVEKPVPPSG